MKSSGSRTMGSSPVGPDAFHIVAHAAVFEDVQAVLCQRGPGDVLAEPLEPFAVTTVDAGRRVHADRIDPGHQAIFIGILAGVLAAARAAGGGSGRVEQAQGGSSGAFGEQIAPPGGCIVAAQQHRLLDGEVVWFEHLIALFALFALFSEPAMRSQHLSDSPGGAGSHGDDIFVAERRQWMELELFAVRILYVYTIERERVRVHIQPQGAVKPLHQGDRSRVCERYARQTEGVLGPEPVEPHDLRHEGVDDIGAQLSVVAQQCAQLEWQAADPLSNWHLGQHPVHQVRGGVVHASARARGADRPALAGEGHQVLEAAPGTLHAGEAVFEQAAGQIALELALDETGQTTRLLGAFDKGRPVLPEYAVKRRMLGLATLVSIGSERSSTRSGRGGARHSCALCMDRAQHVAVSFRVLARRKWRIGGRPAAGRQASGHSSLAVEDSRPRGWHERSLAASGDSCPFSA